MTPIKEESKYEESIRMIEVGDTVKGGEDGPINISLKHLANRTNYLKKQQDADKQSLNNKADKGVTLASYGITDGLKTSQVSQKLNGTSQTNVASEDALRQVSEKVDSIKIPAASTSTAGIVKLNSSINSKSTAEAATPSAVKSAYDLANGRATKEYVDNAVKGIDLSALGLKNIADKAKGWWKCGDTGIIIQYGKSKSNSSILNTFPIAFPNACVSISTSVLRTDDMGSADNLFIKDYKPTGFYSFSRTPGGLAYSFDYLWIAVGY